MNYVGQLAGSVLGRVRDLYKGVNPATLSGSIDVVVIRQPDGSFRSSPFHVRFGKLGILRSAEMGVDIEVNGEPVDLQMRLGENGEAFFVQELEETENLSPLPASSDYSLSPTEPHPSLSESPIDTTTRRQRWSRKGDKRREELTLEVAAEEQMPVLSARESMYFSFCDVAEKNSQSQPNVFYPCYDEELVTHQSSRSPSPKSDSELEMRLPNTPLTEQCMEWDWGRLPQVSRAELIPQISQSAPPSPTNWETLKSQSSFFQEPADQPSTTSYDALEDPPQILDQDACANPPINSPTPKPEDLLSPESQEVSLYFPNSDPYPLPAPPPHQRISEQDSDENEEALVRQQENYIELSLCGGLTDTWDIPMERFLKHQISYSEFCQNPLLIEDTRLVLRIHDKFYNWATAAPIILCKQVFNEDLPKDIVNQLVYQKMPPRSGRWWFSWRRKDLPQHMQTPQTDESEEQKEDLNQHRLTETIVTSELSKTPGQPPQNRRSLRLTSEQIERLNLQDGANEVVFSICTKFQGTCRTRSQIYLWDSQDRIIVSDIDGTVTKSDALGHILPQLGKDWTQQGIVQLYHAIERNGYRFVYCSARSVGLAELTKNFLQRINEGGLTLPLGPLLLSPSSLFTALHREVIEKTPERFKISCLSDIRQLFPDPQPFYAAFGNRPNDVVAYKEVGVPEVRIFTVNPKGELTQDVNLCFKSSYSGLCELVNVMFPSLSCSTSDVHLPEFNHFSYWKDTVATIDEDELAMLLSAQL
ncbi:phosphatidate phosphatase LPIN3-like [Pelobates fuscus]|uniref:phosphatidate phosphatase LPIN3-like n=1 Tax=Pelobates fuscus TaxID=191477 RepID=UPI002FE4AAA4